MKIKNDEQIDLLFRRSLRGNFVIYKKHNKSYRKKPSSYITSIDPFVELFKCHEDFLSRTIARYKNSIVPNNLTVKSNTGPGIKPVTKNAAETLVENEEYTLYANLDLRESFIY